MIPDELITYVQTYFLLTHEQLDTYTISYDKNRVDIPAIKKSSRRNRKVASLTVWLPSTLPSIPEDVIRLFPSPQTKKQLSENNSLYNCMKNGWIIRETRYEKDEKTVASIRYRMGYVLFIYKQKQLLQKEQALVTYLQMWRERKRHIFSLPIVCPLERMPAIHKLNKLLDTYEHKTMMHPDSFTGTTDPSLLFLDFILVFYQVAIIKEAFDWKEIGAVYYNEIGGSKRFDSHKDKFLEKLEQQMHCPPFLFGLVSIGTITPLFFTGQMSGTTSVYHHGTVHATTDYAVFCDCFMSNARVLWLVENRAIVTRMAYEKEFMIHSNSFVLGIDGQLRSSHKKLIEQLVTNKLSQVMIWTDYDEAGLTISRHLYETVQNQGAKTVKWILPDHYENRIVSVYDTYEQSVCNHIKMQRMEQEYGIGGPTDWMHWIEA